MNIGILGCGEIANHHLRHILKDKRVDTVSVADPDRLRAEGIARRYRLKNIYPDLQEMLREQPIDAVHVLTPPASHAELTIQAMEAGCHVLVEKPMAQTEEEAAAMLVAAKRNAVRLYVDHNFLLSPVMNRIRNLVECGHAGNVLHADVQYSFDIRRNPHLQMNGEHQRGWAFHLYGGPLSDHLPHPASLLLNLVSNPLKVWAIKKCNNVLPAGAPDELRVMVDSEGATGLLSVSFGIKPDCFVLNVYATKMTIHANLSNMTLVVRRNRKVSKKLLRLLDSMEQSSQLFSESMTGTLKILAKKAGPPGDIAPVINMFYEGIEKGGDSPISGEAGAQVTRFIEAIWKQMEGA